MQYQESKTSNVDTSGGKKVIDFKTASADLIDDRVFKKQEREIANYPVGRGLKARIFISGASPVTIKSIEKLIKLLELNKEDLPEISSDEKEN
jgi:hypothetical protein